MECPSASQPKGENWSLPLARRGFELAKQALALNPSGQRAVETYGQLGSQVGLIANTLAGSGTGVANLPETIRNAKESRGYYEKALALNPQDLLSLANLAVFHAASYRRAGFLLGASKGQAQTLLGRGITQFNAAPDATPEQALAKGYAALRLGRALTELGDPRARTLNEAALKLGEQAGEARGKCVANLARLQLGKPVSSYQ